ncbi:MAG: DNA polymerase Y family protein [Parvularculaceae bacterium]
MLYEKAANALRLYALDEKAQKLGLYPGQALAEARAIEPSLTLAPAVPQGEARDFRALCAALTRYSPFVGAFAVGDAFLDVTGCAHLFGGEGALLEDACARLARIDFTARAAIADSLGAAFAAAHYGKMRIVPPGGARAALESLPVAALRLEEKTAETLRRLGLKRIGQLYDMPRAPLTARMGSELLRRLAQALGTEDEPIDPIFPPPEYAAVAPLIEPISSAEAIMICLERMTRDLQTLLERDGKGARRFALFLYRIDNRLGRIAVGTARAERNPAVLLRLFKDRLADIHDERDAGFGYDLLKLAAFDCAPYEASAPATFDAPESQGDLSALVARLANRLGEKKVCALRFENAHMPERSAAFAPATKTPPSSFAPPSSPFASRPVALLPFPEKVDAVASVPDGPPMRFTWRRVPYTVRKASGPERIAGDWRRDGGEKTRDYYRVEDPRGRRFWLYREGFFGADERPQWFLHGFFG